MLFRFCSSDIMSRVEQATCGHSRVISSYLEKSLLRGATERVLVRHEKDSNLADGEQQQTTNMLTSSGKRLHLTLKQKHNPEHV